MELQAPLSLPLVFHFPRTPTRTYSGPVFRYLFLAMLLGATGAMAQATDISIQNSTGNIDVRTTLDWTPVGVTAHCTGRECRPGEVQQTQENGTTVYRAQPADGARVDLQVTLPY